MLSIKKGIDTIYDYTYADLILENYNPHSHIKAKVSV